MAAPLPANLTDRVRGILTAAAVGDALGWPQELRSSIVGGQKARAVQPQPRFRSWKRNSGTQYARYQETVNAGEYSDDTQLLLAVARSCLTGKEWLPRLTQVELPTWLLYHRGAGRAVISAARAWADGHPPWEGASERGRSGDPVAQYYQAGANGAAMRIAPHAIITAVQDTPAMLSRVVADAITTHGHPRALVGAAVHALALRHALTRTGVLEYGGLIESLLEDHSWQDPEFLSGILPPGWIAAFEQKSLQSIPAAWKATVRETTELLDIARRSLSRAALANDEQTLEALGCLDAKRNGAGTITAVAAAYVATRSAARPMTGLLRTAFLPKADTDTLASMTASLLGAIHGMSWMDKLSIDVQDSAYLTTVGFQLVEALAKDSPSQPPLFHGEMHDWSFRAAVDKGVRSKDLFNFRDTAFSAGHVSVILPDGRRGDDYKITDIQATGRSMVRRLLLRIADGQTVMIDQVIRKTLDPADAPDRVARGQVHSIGVTLRVADLRRSVTFYRELLGLGLETQSEDSASFSGGISLAAMPRAEDRSSFVPRNFLITVQISDFRDITARLRSSSSVHIVSDDSHGSSPQFRIRDPDGYDLRIVPALRDAVHWYGPTPLVGDFAEQGAAASP